MRLLFTVWATLACLTAAPAVWADSFALRVGRVITAASEGPFEIEDATVLVVDGKIAGVGKGLVIPPGVPVHHYPDAVLMPGLIAADTNLGVTPRSLRGSSIGDESMAAGYRAVDQFDRYADFRAYLKHGVTTIHIDPGAHRLLTGQGAVVSLAGPAAERVLVPSSDLSVNLGVHNPPTDLEFSFPASSEVEIEAPSRQRPTSRLGQFLGLTESIDAASNPDGKFDFHRNALGQAWRAGLPLRIEADRGADLLGAATFLREKKRRGYVVGGAESHLVASTLARQGVPVVYRPRRSFTTPTTDVGTSDASIDTSFADLKSLTGRVALAPPHGESATRLRLTALMAHGAGWDRERAISAITRAPASILGIEQQVGSIASGRRADLVLWTGDPLEVSSHVIQVFVAGRSEYQAPTSTSTIVRAGTIWVSPDQQIEDGELLIEDGRVVAVGRSVPHPPGARVIDAGSDAFVSPGFIDARGHLGLAGDRTPGTPDVDLTLALGVPDVTDARVLRAGVTTVMLTHYGLGTRGARVAAVKTGGDARDDRVIAAIAGITMTAAGQDPIGIQSVFARELERGKKYLASWQKYEKDLAAFLEKEKKGEVKEEKVVEEEVIKTAQNDPISGVWEGTVSGGPLEEPQTGSMSLSLKGSRIEGRVIKPQIPLEHLIVLTLSGKQVTGHVEVETDGMGYPQIEAELTDDDELEGTVSLMGVAVQFVAKRVDKTPVAFKVEKRSRVKSNRPQPPKISPSLEPYRLLLEKKIPAVVDARTPAEIREVVALFVDRYKVPLIILNGNSAEVHGDLLREKKVSVILPRTVVTTRRNEPYNAGAALSRLGLRVGFQSDAEDGARDLPLTALYAVEQGMSPDDALAALTTHVARMFKIDDRVGSLEPGRDADLVIFRGHPFRRGTQVLRVFVGGEEAK